MVYIKNNVDSSLSWLDARASLVYTAINLFSCFYSILLFSHNYGKFKLWQMKKIRLKKI